MIECRVLRSLEVCLANVRLGSVWLTGSGDDMSYTVHY